MEIFDLMRAKAANNNMPNPIVEKRCILDSCSEKYD
jgi:hypothetical protein